METSTARTHQEQVIQMLHELSFPIHRLGYKQLCIGIPRFALDDTQSLSKDLYPFLADYFGVSDWRAVDSTIRDVILTAWETGDTNVWAQYFPSLRKPPSNKQFIATLAERLK